MGVLTRRTQWLVQHVQEDPPQLAPAVNLVYIPRGGLGKAFRLICTSDYAEIGLSYWEQIHEKLCERREEGGCYRDMIDETGLDEDDEISEDTFYQYILDEVNDAAPPGDQDIDDEAGQLHVPVLTLEDQHMGGNLDGITDSSRAQNQDYSSSSTSDYPGIEWRNNIGQTPFDQHCNKIRELIGGEPHELELRDIMHDEEDECQWCQDRRHLLRQPGGAPPRNLRVRTREPTSSGMKRRGTTVKRRRVPYIPQTTIESTIDAFVPECTEEIDRRWEREWRWVQGADIQYHSAFVQRFELEYNRSSGARSLGIQQVARRIEGAPLRGKGSLRNKTDTENVRNAESLTSTGTRRVASVHHDTNDTTRVGSDGESFMISL